MKHYTGSYHLFPADIGGKRVYLPECYLFGALSE